MKLLFMIFLLNLSKNSCAENHADYKNFLLDFFSNKHATVIANLCWDFDELSQFAANFYSLDGNPYLYINTNLSNAQFLESLQIYHYVIIDISCENHRVILDGANKTRKFKSPYKWLLLQSSRIIYSNYSSLDIFMELLKNYTILPDSQVTCAENFERRIVMWNYYKINKTSPMIREKYGDWSLRKGIQNHLSSNVTAFRRRNLNGTTLTIVLIITDNDTFNHLYDYRYVMIDLAAKIQYTLFVNLLHYVNGVPNISSTDKWGVEVSPNVWDGMVGQIQRHEADLTGAGIVFFKQRIKHAQYLFRTHPTQVFFMFRKPPLSYEQNIFTLPFKWTVWVSYVSLVILVVVTLLVTSYFENPRYKPVEQMDFGNILLLVGAAVFQQGCDVVPTGVSGRIVTFVVFLALMFLYVSYSANIVTLLQSTTENIRTHKDLLNSKLKIGAEQNTYSKHYFQNSTSSVIRRMYVEKVGPHGFYNLSDGVQKIREGLFAFHAEESSMYYYILKTFYEHEICECASVPGVLQGDFGWSACAKGSPYTEIFRLGYLKLSESGIQQRTLKLFYEKPKCLSSAPSFTSVGIIDFYPAIVVFLYGVTISVFMLIMEYIYAKIINRKHLKLFLK